MMMSLLILILGLLCHGSIVQADVGGFPALFVIGDSLFDPGNLKFLHPAPNQLPFPIVSSGHLPYGRDFPSHTPTGRYSNGLILPDILASYMGLPYPPAYEEDKANIMKGTNFATAAAQILNKSLPFLYPHLDFGEQVHLFGNVRQQLVSTLGDEQAENLISKSLFLICMGSNDYISAYEAKAVPQRKPQFNKIDFQNILISLFKTYLQNLLDLGVRKFAVLPVPALGCVPFLRAYSKSTGCIESLNEDANNFNNALVDLLQQLQTTHPDSRFSFLNSFNILIDAVAHPSDYGFSYGLEPCCMSGPKGRLPICRTGVGIICKNASEYIFWDFAHPTQAFDAVLANKFWQGSGPDVTPINLQQLASL